MLGQSEKTGEPVGIVKFGFETRGKYEEGLCTVGVRGGELIVSDNPDEHNHLRCCMQFKPALIVDGKRLGKEQSKYWGLHNRTVIGQTASGAIILMIVKRRGWKLGVSVNDVIRILEQNRIVNACNLDGGSSLLFKF